MKEIFQSLFDTSKDRIKSPFIGSYITAFIIYNWRAFFLLLFSDAKIEDKIVVINHEYCYKEAILVPLFIALFYIMVLPYINLIFDKLLSYSNKIKDEREKNGEINKLHQKKAVAKLEREIAEERAGTSEISELKNQIERLTTENKNLGDQNKDAFERYEKSLEQQKAEETALKKSIENLRSSNRDLEREMRNQVNEIESNSTILTERFLKQLSDHEITYFLQFGSHRLEPKPNKSMSLNVANLEKLTDLGLLFYSRKDDRYDITDLGKYIYYYILKKENN